MRFACLLLTLLTAPTLTAAAQTSGTLSGRVVDTTGAVVPGVTISARHLERGVERATVTNADGRFVMAALPVGFSLEVGALAESVSVAGAATAVNTRTGELSYLVDARAIEQLPLNGRNYTDLAFLQPGVTPYPPPSRRRFCGRAWPGHGRERSGPARERVSARRHTAERHDQRPRRQRRGDRAWHRNRAGVPRRDQRLRRRVRPHERRPGQRHHEVG